MNAGPQLALLPDVCTWYLDNGTVCGKPAVDAIVFEPHAKSLHPDSRVSICAEHYAAASAWIGANLGTVLGAGDPA